MEIKSQKKITDAIKENYKSIYAYGIIDEATGHLIYDIFDKLNRPVFVLFENDKKAYDFYEKMEAFTDKINYFPDLQGNYHLIEDLDYTNKTHRMKTLVSLFEKRNSIIVSSLQAISRKLMNVKMLEEKMININISSEIDLPEFISNLSKLGYQRRNIIESKGEFAIRGDIIDIYQVHEDYPTRIELFDIEIDSIRKFDINTQMSIKNIDKICIYPNIENFIEENLTKNIISSIDKDIDFSMKKLDTENSTKLIQKFERLKEELLTNKSVENIDLIIPYLNTNNNLIFDYLSTKGLVVFNDFNNIEDIFKKFEEIRLEEIHDRFENGQLLKSHNNIFFSFNHIYDSIDKLQKLNITSLLKSVKTLQIDKLIELKIRENQSYFGKYEDFISDLRKNIASGYFYNIYIEDSNNSKNFKNKLMEEGIDSEIIPDLNSKSKIISIVSKYLEKGFDFYEDKHSFISYSQIFKKAHKKKSKIVKNKDIINYSDLVPGDLLVHDNHGIGQYIGIKNIELNNIKSDYIEIVYKDGGKLFVPTNDMDMVSKFVGNADKKPELSSLGGSEWKRAKHKAKRAIEEIAEDLVKLYAKRSETVGHSFSEDTVWQREFEDNFKYQETDAQLRAIREIKDDMESSRVMDRLLCGDVGYGKTEVAIRAAFKAVMDGKQAVMIAPTTILVKQHFETIKERFADFPINIDYLSRFKTPAQKKKVIEGLKNGKIDFVVGTHSLIAKDVDFKNLGLLIVDEEQRFGVRQKEKIKSLAEDIDVLTLSATPIPRTLQMSLSGIRDMSILDEHPANRLPANTFVMEYDPLYIREAILKEMSRGGQAYFVYNRVRSINRMYQKLIELVPEARIAMAHGQMSTRELENILEDFTNNKYDILLSTTIIETGMDIQNVNTIIIYNADMMGLSQLYQLKGRIGRSDRNSFAYFTYKKDKVLTEIAEKRLKAIKDFTELGSGYKVAMRDLELRGAGNLLGESQSGHIEQIGYDLFVRMLRETIDEIKGLKTRKIDVNVKIDLNLDVYIPSSYIKDANEKINIYKKISGIESQDDHYGIIDELTDRFGDIPLSVQNIIDIAYIKSMMIENNMSSIIEKDGYIEISYDNIEIFEFEKLKVLSSRYQGEMKFNLIGKPTIFIPNNSGYTIKLLELLQIIAKINKGEFNEED